ncbi:ABC transporter permease [Sporosarcina sp. ACRSL]|uniref:ABC transporter permease n=1 Tax=Sporosarcina sp. ACRSL TaxID=2918215 RepID=UPI001EF4C5EC|nr:ABC transporter permease [Sporosarcina sp. ACRSL]MCG7345571.1 ABC transporter permease [Sporosarcina sp. ACRSL]
MNSLREIWGNRFVHYMTELQKYMKFVFTGHLAIVLLFTIGAGGYAYSEWLKEVPSDFPSAIIAAVVIGAALCIGTPVTLMKPADIVFFLPLEKKLDDYMRRSLRYTFFSQLPVPLLLYIVFLPLLSATGAGGKQQLILTAVVIFLVKWLYVESEFHYRRANEGKGIWKDWIVRFVLAALLLYVMLAGSPYFVPLIGLLMAVYYLYWKKRSAANPFPYEHFITVEQNRMMRFYRFANYFTDVPHLKGSVSRRAWLGFLMRSAQFGQTSPQRYLLRRTLVRTDDIFWLWVRLTGLSVIGVALIPFPIVVYIFIGALAFASSIQLVHALRAGDDFRMDMLFPEMDNTRVPAIRKTVSGVQLLQAIFVLATGLLTIGIAITPVILSVIVLIVSEVTLRVSNGKTEEA